MSYIYALYFPKQNAVKIGKADNLKTRLSQLVATWGPISTSKARAWSVEDTFVLGAEKDLHRQFDTYHKDMPEGDGYSEFFEPCIWDQLNHSQFLPISKTKILYKVNQTKALAPKTYQSITLTVTEHEKEKLLTIYGNTTTIKKQLFDSFNLSLTDAQCDQLQEIKENETIATLKRDNAILKNQVDYHQNRANNNIDKIRRLTVMKSENFRKLSEKDKTIGQLSNELNCYKNQGLLSDNDKSTIKLQLTISELKEENKRLNGRIRELKQRNERALDTYEKRRQLLKKAYRTMKKAVTQLKKIQKKPQQTLANELTDIINDIYLYT
jgi:hypothetical protein